MKIESLYMVLGALLFVIGYLSCMALYNLPDNGLKSEVYTNCSGLDLFKTSECLREQIRPFYIYNLSNQDKDLNFEELKEIGGSCIHWSKYYYDNIDTTRFFRKQIEITTSNNSGHRFTIISDKTGYCILDEINVECTKLG
jgi:hypothetical protein